MTVHHTTFLTFSAKHDFRRNELGKITDCNIVCLFNRKINLLFYHLLIENSPAACFDN